MRRLETILNAVDKALPNMAPHLRAYVGALAESGDDEAAFEAWLRTDTFSCGVANMSWKKRKAMREAFMAGVRHGRQVGEVG